MKILHLCLMLVTLLPCAEAANLSLEQRLSAQLDTPGLAGEAVWLDAEGTRFLGIHSPSDRNPALGGVILLHDAGTHADWHEVIHPLRLALAEQGWNTLSLQLPALDAPPTPLELESLLAQANARIKAAVDYFGKRQVTDLVLLGHGLGAVMGLNFTRTPGAGPFKALVAIGVDIPTGGEQDPVRQALAQRSFPLYDLYGRRDRKPVIDSAVERRRIARQVETGGYRQESMAGADHFFNGLQNGLSQRVIAWLKAAGSAEP
ncbi:MAG: alpha/beta fold hydrolase [Candidatus Thiodiazotropha sp.]